jgi:hypothetical protein
MDFAGPHHYILLRHFALEEDRQSDPVVERVPFSGYQRDVRLGAVLADMLRCCGTGYSIADYGKAPWFMYGEECQNLPPYKTKICGRTNLQPH